jgi:diguanylate cyclase (GGDEF)-like protein/PAS domain S-box-containing protein
VARFPLTRRGGRAVECTGLENRSPFTRTAGSNPAPSALLVAVALFGAVTALRFVAGADLSDAVTLLYTLPVALLAVHYGPPGGIAGAGVATGLFAVRAVAGSADVSAAGYLTRGGAFLLMGVLVGALSGRRAPASATDTRWFEMSNDMLVEASLDGYFTRLSDRWEQCLGWTREELMSRPFREFIHPDDLDSTMPIADSLDRRPDEVVNFENRYMAKDGSWRWLLWSARSDEHRKYAVAKDITDRKRLEQEHQDLLDRVEALARTDPTTGLPNRRSWEEEVRGAIARAQRQGTSLAVALVDLDRFKLFNDTHGHPAGDALLAEAAGRWRMTLRVTDFIARYGGEEFALLLPDCPADEALVVLERLREATPGNQTASAGIAHWEPSESPESLVARADAALYEAKDAGRDRVVTSAVEGSRSPYASISAISAE